MKKQEIIQKLPDGIFSRQQILHAAQSVEPSFKDTQLRYLIGTLRNSKLIVRIGRNQYKKAEKEPNKSIFTGAYSDTALHVIGYMKEHFPLLSYRVWELSWLNEFFNHLIAHNHIFLEVEKDGCDFVFSALTEKFPGKVLLKATVKEMMLYGTDDGIIITRLVTEAPRSDSAKYQVPLEKLIVDLFANKNLMLSKADYPFAIELMFSKYRIDQVTMLRYARRRNKANEVVRLLQDYPHLFISITT
ncbi:hypothetical protein SpiGrapes_2438 [Sphaerochaeta pleomorpha str. Grapes]|uniref:Uncharacterized protein n=1 Tax=Sphaerochaeta pleomorpha (strain ATCC BAA-1885 / DSM 22778 / Grapes) TaxID=158190 RepID=G8QTG4_SPHPG|nr:DUF6577 family protein [Sphaerochaeta pleomorpha]AEV30205.1 hypothetical protein SpiGrapes_2438 [Sphaerochaeta pleomorpha str. Grapes]